MKKLNKKLTLNKETISRLNDEQMGNVKGGYDDGRKTCNSRCNTCCPKTQLNAQ